MSQNLREHLSRLVSIVVRSAIFALLLLPRDQMIASATSSAGAALDRVPELVQIPARDGRQGKPGTASVRGRVLASDTGLPLRKAQVRIISTGSSGNGQSSENRLAMTDVNGRYEFKDLTEGRYSVTVSKSGYLTLFYGQRRPFQPGITLDVVEGLATEKVDFVLPRGAAITGRVLDEFGDSVSDVQVTAARYSYSASGRRLVSAGRFGITNDIGEFRVFGLSPGEYFLTATLSNPAPVDKDEQAGYAQTYYPGTADIAAAQRVTVGIGQTINDLALTLVPIRPARVSGTAVDSDGRPMSGITAWRAGELGLRPPTASGQVRLDGSFAINGLTPGNYRLQAESGRGGSNESAFVDISVSGDDINGLHIVGVAPSTITGRLQLKSTKVQTLLPSTIRVTARPILFGPMQIGPRPESATIGGDLTFQVKATPGLTFLDVTGQAAEWLVKAIRYRGRDVTDKGIDIRPMEDIGDVEIELTDRATNISGIVSDSRGDQVKDYWLVMFSRDRDKWPPPTRFVRGVRPDRDGSYKTTGLPPGEYLAFAADFIESGQWFDVDFLDEMRTRATTVSLAEGQTTTLNLKLLTQ